MLATPPLALIIAMEAKSSVDLAVGFDFGVSCTLLPSVPPTEIELRGAKLNLSLGCLLQSAFYLSGGSDALAGLCSVGNLE